MLKEVRNLGLILCAVLVACFVGYKLMSPAVVPVPVVEVPNPSIVVSTISNLAASHSYSYGPVDAKVTVVEFFDPECESCAAVAPYIKNEMKHYDGKIRWVFRYMGYHFNSKTAIKVLEAARKQNAFLELKDLLFKNQKTWGEKRVSTENEILRIASQLKSLDMKKLKKDMADPAFDEVIEKDLAEGKAAGVTGTPTFFVNGVILDQLDMDLLIKRIEERL